MTPLEALIREREKALRRDLETWLRKQVTSQSFAFLQGIVSSDDSPVPLRTMERFLPLDRMQQSLIDWVMDEFPDGQYDDKDYKGPLYEVAREQIIAEAKAEALAMGDSRRRVVRRGA